MLYIGHTNEKIEHTHENAYQEFAAYLRMELAISFHDFQYESCKPVIYLFHGSGAQIIWNRLMLISKGFNLLFRYSLQARKTFTDHACFL